MSYYQGLVRVQIAVNGAETEELSMLSSYGDNTRDVMDFAMLYYFSGCVSSALTCVLILAFIVSLLLNTPMQCCFVHSLISFSYLALLILIHRERQ